MAAENKQVGTANGTAQTQLVSIRSKFLTRLEELKKKIQGNLTPSLKEEDISFLKTDHEKIFSSCEKAGGSSKEFTEARDDFRVMLDNISVLVDLAKKEFKGQGRTLSPDERNRVLQATYQVLPKNQLDFRAEKRAERNANSANQAFVAKTTDDDIYKALLDVWNIYFIDLEVLSDQLKTAAVDADGLVHIDESFINCLKGIGTVTGNLKKLPGGSHPNFQSKALAFSTIAEPVQTLLSFIGKSESKEANRANTAGTINRTVKIAPADLPTLISVIDRALNSSILRLRAVTYPPVTNQSSVKANTTPNPSIAGQVRRPPPPPRRSASADSISGVGPLAPPVGRRPPPLPRRSASADLANSVVSSLVPLLDNEAKSETTLQADPPSQASVAPRPNSVPVPPSLDNEANSKSAKPIPSIASKFKKIPPPPRRSISAEPPPLPERPDWARTSNTDFFGKTPKEGRADLQSSPEVVATTSNEASM